MTDPIAKTRIVKDREWDEWVVKCYDSRGNHMPDCDYFTQDKEDAIATAEHIESQGVTESTRKKNRLFKGWQNNNPDFKGNKNKAMSKKRNSGKFYGESKSLREKCPDKKNIKVYGGDGKGSATIDKKSGKLSNDKRESRLHRILMRRLREAISEAGGDARMEEPKKGPYAYNHPKDTNEPFKNKNSGKFYGKNKQRGISEADQSGQDGSRMTDFFGDEDEVHGSVGGGTPQGFKKMADYFINAEEVDSGDGQDDVEVHMTTVDSADDWETAI